MLDALSSFFKDSPEGDGSRVNCTRRGGFSRPNEDYEELARQFSDQGYITYSTISDFEAGVSSTEVRKRRAEGAEWREMVPERVARLIENGGVYSTQGWVSMS